MPQKRGRKRRPRDRRASGETTTATSPPPGDSRLSAGAPAVPSNTARATGFAIAVVTVFLAILMIADAFVADRETADAVVRGMTGAFLALLGVVIGVLSLFPAQVRRLVRGA